MTPFTAGSLRSQLLKPRFSARPERRVCPALDHGIRQLGPLFERPGSERGTACNGACDPGIGIGPEERARTSEVSERPRRGSPGSPVRLFGSLDLETETPITVFESPDSGYHARKTRECNLRGGVEAGPGDDRRRQQLPAERHQVRDPASGARCSRAEIDHTGALHADRTGDRVCDHVLPAFRTPGGKVLTEDLESDVGVDPPDPWRAQWCRKVWT